MSDTSHRATFFLMKVVARVGEAVMMRLKRRYRRPRPSQYYPALYPPVPVPGHASYPAGHALIAQLTARVLIDVTNPIGPPPSPYEKSLRALADRIGRNRVIAGLHFWSDIREGAAAGDKIHAFLRGMPKPNVAYPLFNYHTALNNARDEWGLPPLP